MFFNANFYTSPCKRKAPLFPVCTALPLIKAVAVHDTASSPPCGPGRSSPLPRADPFSEPSATQKACLQLSSNPILKLARLVPSFRYSRLRKCIGEQQGGREMRFSAASGSILHRPVALNHAPSLHPTCGRPARVQPCLAVKLAALGRGLTTRPGGRCGKRLCRSCV